MLTSDPLTVRLLSVKVFVDGLYDQPVPDSLESVTCVFPIQSS